MTAFNPDVRFLSEPAADLVPVCLVEGAAPAPYAECPLVPNPRGGFFLYVQSSDFKWAQMAGRKAASGGLFKVALSSTNPLLLDEHTLHDFIVGLFDSCHEIAFYADMSEDTRIALMTSTAYLIEARLAADMSASDMFPEKLASYLEEMVENSCTDDGCVTCSRLNIKEHGFSGLEYVGAGSSPSRPSVMSQIDYVPKGKVNDGTFDIILVGKGITFDTGGYDLKPPKFMQAMRTDKCGAVYLATALALAIENGLDKKVRLLLPLSDNCISGSAMKPGDIICYPNNMSVEVLNTDAEGRLILADGIIEGCKCAPSYLIIAATLTGAAKTALGRDITAYFTDDDELSAQVQSAFESNHELCWRLPLFPHFAKALKSKRAVLNNSASDEGVPGASSAAMFLKSFVSGNPRFLHFDLSSAYSNEGGSFYCPQFPTGASIMSLASLLCSLE